ncbi:MAG: esterase-like activity of phytase family protein [Leptolyngbyaceae cyanobacterium T60_A2020_046]|nr:esterase-like activity of phytase family protein [Leptolyngbyaceae cyanobacterium T60_A2020_046]
MADRIQTRNRLSQWLHLLRRHWSRFGVGIGAIALMAIAGCAVPQVSAEDRLFLNATVEVLDVATLPPQTFDGTPVGGLSALAYDRQRNQFYALSDDRGTQAPPRVYTLNLEITPGDDPKIGAIAVTNVTLLRDTSGEPYPPNQLDPEGMALSPRDSLFISSEGVPSAGSPPLLNEYDRATGQLRTVLRLPDRYLPDDATPPSRGIRTNLGLESLTLSPTGGGEFEPFRLFTATESALAQDYDDDPANPLTGRLLHYLIGPNQSTLISEHAYPLELEPLGSVVDGLTALVALDAGGHFLALERAYGLGGFAVKLFQLASGPATDTSTLAELPRPLDGITPIQKQLLLDLSPLDPRPDNLEGMTLGPPLRGGGTSLWLISDDNFAETQTTQIWLLRLRTA